MHRKHLRVPSIYLANTNYSCSWLPSLRSRDLEFLECPYLEDGELPSSTSSANANLSLASLESGRERGCKTG